MTWTQTQNHLNNDISFNISLICFKFPILLDEVQMKETCLRFFIQVLDLVLSNVENKLLKNGKRLPFFLYTKKKGLNKIFEKNLLREEWFIAVG